MKKILLLIIVFLSVGYSSGQNSIWIDTVSSGQNQEVQFEVKIQNSQLFTAFQLDITLPGVLDYKPNSIQLDATRKADHVITGSMMTGNVLRIIAYSIAKNNFNGIYGTVAVFRCVSKTAPDDYMLIPSNIIISDPNNVNLTFTSFSGKYTLLNPAINIVSSSINFGSIALGQINDQTIQITNNGNLPLSVLSFSSNSSEMKCTDSSAVIVQPLQTIYKTVRFAPVIKGNKSGAIILKSNDPNDSIKTVVLSGIGYAVNEIHIGTINGRSGQDGDLTISINNMEAFTAFEFTLALPGEMKYKFGSAVMLRKADHAVSVDTISGNKLRVIAYSPSNNYFSGNSGDILKLSFALLGQGGNYSIPVSDAIIGDASNTNVISASYAGNLQIASPYLSISSSQINYGAVAVTDTGKGNIIFYNYGNDTLKINSITSNNGYYFVNETYPIIILQGDQRSITVKFHGTTAGSYAGRLTIYSNDAPRNPSYIDLSGSLFIPNTLSVTSEVGLVNDTIAIPFTIENMEQFTAFQFDVTLPAQAEFIHNSIGLNQLRANGHSVSYSILSSGAIRILAFSMNQNAFKGNSGEVVNLKVKLTGSFGTYPINISNLIIGNSENQNIATGSNNGSVVIDHSVPVELEAFKGALVNNKIFLVWKTASEIDNIGFDVERKMGNESWTIIGHAAGKGTTFETTNYQFTDKFNDESFKGIIFYRLRQIDADGNYKFSNEINIDADLTPKGFSLSQNYPNPFNPSTIIKYQVPFESRIVISVYNSLGECVRMFNAGTKQTGYYEVRFNAPDLASGIYIYIFKAVSLDGKNSFSTVKKMMLVK